MKTAISGPMIIYGQRPPQGTGATGLTNTDQAPSLSWGGVGLLDPRLQYNRTRIGALGFLGSSDIPVIDAVPATLGTAKYAALQATTAATAMTLAVASTGITVLPAALQVWPSGNSVPSGALVCDANPALVAFGRAGNANSSNTIVSLYDPTKAIARNVTVTSGADFSANTFTVRGYDIYGYPMSEAITGPNNTTTSGKKAFKFVTSITPSATNASTVSIGTGDVYGFPLRVDSIGYVSIAWNGSLVTANTGWLAADATTPATTTTGDVRGTYATQSASDGSKRLQVFATPSVANLGSVTGLFGITQV